MPLNDLHRPLQETVPLTAAKRSLESSMTGGARVPSAVEAGNGQPINIGVKVIDRRTVLQAGAMLAAAGPALLRGVHAEARGR